MSMPGPLELIIVLIIVALLFGTKKLRSLGGDLGGAIKSFRGALKDTEEEEPSSSETTDSSNVIEGEKVQNKEENQ